MTAWQVTATTATGGTVLFGVVTISEDEEAARDAARRVLGNLPLAGHNPLSVTPLPPPKKSVR